MVRKRSLRRFVFRGSKPRKRRKASGAARQKAPAHCNKGLSACMKGGGGRTTASGGMKSYWRCRKGG